MMEIFESFGPCCMNFRKFHNHAFEFYQFEVARSIHISSVVIKKFG